MLIHVDSKQRSGLFVGFTLERRIRSRVGRESQSGEGVHDEVHPEELHGCQDGAHLRVRDGGDEGEEDGCDVDGDLELSSQSRILYIE